ncbi:MAG: DUF3263 domain-containing protein [Lacisediminihabitans sp.]
MGLRAESAGRPAPHSPVPDLSARAESILAFERRSWTRAGVKEEAIRAEFGLSAARYYQLLNAVLDSPAAIMNDPMLVKRLRRLRDARTTARSARALGDAAARTDHHNR